MGQYGIAAFVDMVRQRVETEGLRPFAIRTGIPLGGLRSVIQGRAARSTTLQAIAAVMGMRLFIAPMNPGGTEAPPLPEELTRALDLPSDASVAEAVDAITTDAAGSDLRKAMRLMHEMAKNATTAADLLPRLANESAIRMVPFAEHVEFDAATGELEFEESSALAIAVAERVLPSWAQSGSPDVRQGSRRFAGGDGRRPRRGRQRPAGSGRGGTVRRRHRRRTGGQAASEGREPADAGARPLRSCAEAPGGRRPHRGPGGVVLPPRRHGGLTGGPRPTRRTGRATQYSA